MSKVLQRSPEVVQLEEIPESIRRLTTIPAPDYVDVFAVGTGEVAEGSPERWARVALEGVPPAGRFLIWQVLCGLRLDKAPARDSVAGWRVAERSDSGLRLEASSWFMTAEAVIEVGHGRLAIALFVRYDQPAGRIIWPPLSVVHRQLMPGLLRLAVRRMER